MNSINATANRVEAAGHQVSCAHGVSHLPVWKSWAQPRICNKSALSHGRPPLYVTSDPCQRYADCREKVLVLASVRQPWVWIKDTEGVQGQS